MLIAEILHIFFLLELNVLLDIIQIYNLFLLDFQVLPDISPYVIISNRDKAF
jgi:hypothetical protein